MRRLVGLVVVVCVLALAGCTRLPDGVDGDLVNNWGPMPAPASTFPGVGKCLASNTANLVANPPVSCSVEHSWEIVALGTFAGSVAHAAQPPIAGSSAMRAAYGYCQAPARQYLGADWHDGLLDLSVLQPDDGGWNGGARWFACTVTVAATVDYGGQISRRSSLKGVLTKAGPLKLACANWLFQKEEVDDIETGSCAKPHSGEFVGAITVAGSAYPSAARWGTIGDSDCRAAVAHYLGFPGTTYDNAWVGWVYLGNSEEQWDTGDHEVRCYAVAYTHDHKFAGTVKGIGSAKPKG